MGHAPNVVLTRLTTVANGTISCADVQISAPMNVVTRVLLAISVKEDPILKKMNQMKGLWHKHFQNAVNFVEKADSD